MTSLFSKGLNGLADSPYSGTTGSVAEVVGVDYRSKPGLIQAQQSMEKVSGETINELVKASIALPNNSTLWFSSQSGKIWRELAGVWSLAHTTVAQKWSLVLAVLRGGVFKALDPTYPQPFNINDFYVDSGGSDVLVRSSSYFIVYESRSAAPWSFKDMEMVERVDFDPNDNRDLRGMTMSAQGNRIFVAGGNSIYQFNLTGYFRLAGYTLGATFTNLRHGGAESLFFNETGTRMYVLERSGFLVCYNLSTPWSIATATFVSGNELSVNSGHRSISFSPNGRFVYLTDHESANRRNDIAEIELNTPWDFSAGFKAGRLTQLFDNRARYFTGRMQFKTIDGEDRAFVLSGEGGYSFSNDIVLEFDMGDSIGGMMTCDARVHAVSQVFEDRYGDLSPVETEESLYWSTEKILWRVPLSNGSPDWDSVQAAGHFKNGDKEFHPIVEQNLKLYIGDKIDIAQVDEWGNFSPQTNFTLRAPERIQTMIDYDLDILVGTQRGSQGRVLRWFTENESWNAEDTIEESGVNAFIRDDNFVYVQAGDHGQIYFYNGEKLLKDKRIPGEYKPLSSARVYPNAVGYHLGVPVFGFSNISGNPAPQGLYSYGSHSKDYPVTLSLDFPLSTGDFTNITIGAVLTVGADLYTAYKIDNGATVIYGVDKLNWNKKYDKAYFLTRFLTAGEDRSVSKSISRLHVPFHSLPADTEVKVSLKSRASEELRPITTVVDAKMSEVRADRAIAEVANPQLKVELLTKENESPEIEDLVVSLSGIKRST